MYIAFVRLVNLDWYLGRCLFHLRNNFCGECESGVDCNYHGSCQNKKCACGSPWIGTKCQTYVACTKLSHKVTGDLWCQEAQLDTVGGSTTTRSTTGIKQSLHLLLTTPWVTTLHHPRNSQTLPLKYYSMLGRDTTLQFGKVHVLSRIPVLACRNRI